MTTQAITNFRSMLGCQRPSRTFRCIPHSKTFLRTDLAHANIQARGINEVRPLADRTSHISVVSAELLPYLVMMVTKTSSNYFTVTLFF
jgi:hypothetical protein